MIYLASPYTHPDEAVREQRFRAACKLNGNLINQGLVVYSPIVHCHPIAKECGLPTTWTFWATFDRDIISKCEKLFVMMLDGWEQSKGVNAEISIALELNIPVEYIDAI